MINFSFGLSNPFLDTADSRNPQKDYIEFDKSVSKNKSLSLQISKTVPWSLFDVCFRSSIRAEDHAGIYLQLSIWRYFMVLNLYDKRHWNYDENRWYEYDEEWQ